MLRGVAASLLIAIPIVMIHLVAGRGEFWNLEPKLAFMLAVDVVFLASPVLAVVGALLGRFAVSARAGAAAGVTCGFVVAMVLTFLDGMSAIGILSGSVLYALAGAVLGRAPRAPAG